MQEEKIEGIVLRSMEYKERQRIITVFSQEMGVISLIIKGLSKNNYRLLSLTTPFSRAEFIYTRGNSDLFRFIDGTMIDEHLKFREKFSFLKTAGLLTQAIVQSQLPGKPSAALYLLLRSYLKQIPSFENPDALISSFYLKLLRYEGLLSLSEQCSHCEEHPSLFLSNGESLCHVHKTPESYAFSKEEWMILLTLAETQQFNTLRTLQIPPNLLDTVTSCFLDNF